MSEPSQSTSVPQLKHTTLPREPISENVQFTDLSSRFDQQRRNVSKPIKATVKAASEQPSVAMLASLGIKVRDFAYESKLPPIQPVYRHPRQIQPAVVRTTLKHQWPESGEDDPFAQSSLTSQKRLERTSTEPIIPPDSGPSAHMLGIDDGLQIISQQSNVFHSESPPHSQMPPSIFGSQESEPYVDTPPVTPKGSLWWPIPDPSNIPASQLDTEFQSMVSELPSYSQLGSFQISNASFSQRPAVSDPSLSLANIKDGLSFSNSTPPRPPHGNMAGHDPSHDIPAPTIPRTLATRYHLRKRPAPPSSPFSSTKSSSSRLHSLRPRGAVIPPSRPHHVSIQSSHSRAKPKDESSSPSSRILLRRAVTNEQEKRRRMG